MRIVVCGAGQVGTHTAQVLNNAGHQITLIDHRADRLATIEQTMDIRTFTGSAASADVLIDAGAPDADLLVAATSSDEVNLLTCAVAKGLGTGKTVARVHHSAFFDERGLNYRRYFNIDELICPEYSTAHAIASMLRSPGALAIESFGRGQIQMQELAVDDRAPAVGKQLIDLKMPQGLRLAAVERDGQAFLPHRSTEIQRGDRVILVANDDLADTGRKLFTQTDDKRMRVVIMGGTSMAVWVCRALHDRLFSVRLFETDRQRAEELAAKLDWVTVIREDPTDQAVFEEERLSDADVFAALTIDDDERNIIACAVAKSMGVDKVVAVVQRPDLGHLLSPIGIDAAFNPRILAAREIIGVMDESPMLSLATLAGGIINVYRIRLKQGASAVGQSLRDIRLTPDWMIAAIAHGDDVRVGRADDTLSAGDTLLVIGKRGAESKLKGVLID